MTAPPKNPQKSINSGKSAEKSPFFSLKSHRFRLTLLFCYGIFCTSSMRLSLGFATVCMVNSTSTAREVQTSTTDSNSTTHHCAFPITEESREGYTGSLDWSPGQQAFAMSGTFYGGLFTIAISGYVADRFGPKSLLLVAMLDYVLVTFLTPVLAPINFNLFYASRLFMGLGEGFVIPCINSIGARWIPTHEKATMAALFTSGNQIGASLTPLFSSLLCASTFGWPSIFYVYGVVGLSWVILWYIFASDTPAKNKYVSEQERSFLNENLPVDGQLPKNVVVPWRKLLLQPPCLALYFCNFTDLFSVIVMQGYLPVYMIEVLQLPIRQNGMFTMVPFISQMIAKNLMAFTSSRLKSRGILSNTSLVRLFQAISSYGSSIALIALSIIPDCTTPLTALPILAIYGATHAACTCGYFTSMISIAPAYAGTLSSFGRVLATLGNIAGTTMITLLVSLEIPHKWPVIFCTTAAIKSLSATVFVVYGKGDVQDWAIVRTKEDGEDTKNSLE